TRMSRLWPGTVTNPVTKMRSPSPIATFKSASPSLAGPSSSIDHSCVPGGVQSSSHGSPVDEASVSSTDGPDVVDSELVCGSVVVSAPTSSVTQTPDNPPPAHSPYRRPEGQASS